MDGICRKLYHPSLKTYFILVLVPQILWILSSPNGFTAVCESCCNSNYQQLLLMKAQATNRLAPRADCKTTTDRLQSDRDCVDSNHVEQSANQKLTSMQTDMYSDVNVSSLCTCSIDQPSHKRSYSDSKEMRDLSKSEMDGGWHIPHNLPNLAGPCNIKRRNSSLSQQEFLEKFAYTEPVILTGMSDQSVFRASASKYRLLRDYGQELITVATANTQSYRKVKMTLCEYIDRIMKPQTFYSMGNETLYHFGDNDREGWAELFSLYQLPPYELPGLQPVLSFGLAGPGTGLPFHIHGPTFAETIYGRKHERKTSTVRQKSFKAIEYILGAIGVQQKKRWFLYPPADQPTFHPDVTTLNWITFTLPHLPPEQQPMECTLQPGEILYFADRWWHATLNVDSAVFVSTFYS